MEEIRKMIWKLSQCQGISPVGVWKVITFGKQKQYWDFDPSEIIRIAQLSKSTNKFLESWRRVPMEKYERQQFITVLDSSYPQLLKEIADPPAILYYRGNLGLLKGKKIAFVGARDATHYGKQAVKKIIPKIVNHNYTIVSGLAKGIDGYAHHYALQAAGNTIGVIGTGVDVCYPRETAFLHLEMAKRHLILSEYPDGTKPARYHFPQRNRIIAGLAQGTCVVEAKARSGSLITAQLALEYGREVFAIPGSILKEHSTGCHQLIQDGAKCTNSVQDILDELRHFN